MNTNEQEREEIRARIMRHYNLYKVHGSRIKRLLYAPWHTGTFYILNAFAKIHPFKVSKIMPWGRQMRFYLPEGNQIYYYDFWEANFAIFLTRYLKSDDIFVDVGSHVGYYASLAQSLVGAEGAVIAIEPTPRTYDSLVENLKDTPAHTFSVAISDTEGEITFHDYGPAYSAFNTFNVHTEAFEDGIGGAGNEIRVRARTLDSILSEVKRAPTFIKIDAEGAEAQVLAGAVNSLKQHRPLLSIEVGGDAVWDDMTTNAISLLKSLEYTPYEMTLEGYLKTHTIKSRYDYDNLIWIPKEKVETLEKFIVRD